MGILLIARFTIRRSFPSLGLLLAMLLLNLLLLVLFAFVLNSAYTSIVKIHLHSLIHNCDC